jgi:hypothetical protein
VVLPHMVVVHECLPQQAHNVIWQQLQRFCSCCRGVLVQDMPAAYVAVSMVCKHQYLRVMLQVWFMPPYNWPCTAHLTLAYEAGPAHCAENMTPA